MRALGFIYLATAAKEVNGQSGDWKLISNSCIVWIGFYGAYEFYWLY